MQQVLELDMMQEGGGQVDAIQKLECTEGLDWNNLQDLKFWRDPSEGCASLGP